MLQLKNIVKDYEVGAQVIHALRGINVDFRKNEFVSILGPSGCGKTTLMNIIGGLDRYTEGDLTINGITTKSFIDQDWDNYRNKRIGFVFQTYNLIPHLSVLKNVELALTLSGASKEERAEKAKAALIKVGLSDYLKQKPNQLSGGQMQRVAIARAIVNEPDILLADEPTGALDTDTSTQIIDLIKSISKDKLVIMVTHNPEIAEKYSTRLIKMVDGLIISDSMPYNADKDSAFVAETERKKAAAYLAKKDGKKIGKAKKKSAMTYGTALSLSWKNLLTKRARTILTSVAGSIGIIGIALILALSSGLNGYISKLQTDTLSSNPITITETTIDISQAMRAGGNEEVWEEFPLIEKIFVEKAQTLSSITTKNNITQEYLDYIENNLDASWYSDIIYTTGMELAIFGQKPGIATYTKLTESDQSGGGMSSMFSGSASAWQLLPDTDFLTTQYDILAGGMPQSKNDIIIVVDDTNRISESTLIALGLKAAGDDVTEYSFEEVLGKEYKLVSNDLLYELSESRYVEKSPLDIDYTAAETLTIAGIVRINKETDSGVLSTGLGYTKELYAWLQSENIASEIVAYMNANPLINPFTGIVYETTLSATKEQQQSTAFRQLGGNSLPNTINIYPASYDTKALLKVALDDYNTGRAEGDMVTYTDMSELLGDALSSIVDIISYVLIAFTAISLLVSSIMIGIITYVSVLERTKEIGILRSIGARKKDVTRVFNAETILIGLFAGALGVGMAYLLSVPINLIIKSLVGISGIASLNIGYALLLVGISVVLTLVSGLIPSLKAAKKDPVTALRTE